MSQWLLHAMRKNYFLNLTLAGILFGITPHLSAQATTETITVATPGTLSELVENLPTSRITSLTVKGALNAADIAYLRKGAGKITKTETLDISEVSLVPGKESYGSQLITTSDVGFSTITQYYYISDEYRVYTDSESTGLGGSTTTEHVYCNDLSGAFAECSNYKSIALPQCLKGIGQYMFLKNEVIESVNIPDNATYLGVKAFRNCKNLKSMALPNGIEKIPAWTFAECGIVDLSFSERLDSIEEMAFYGCPIKSANLSNVKYIGQSAFYGNYFQGELNLANLDTIREWAFNSSTSEITDIKFSDRLKVIEDYAFGKSNITNLILPEGLERIGNSVFSGFSKLENVEIPKSLQIIGQKAFAQTPWESSLQSEDGVVYIGSIAYKYNADTAPESTSFSFKEGTTSISNGIFFPWYSVNNQITSIKLPSSLQYIGDECFSNCPNLEEINLPDKLKEIGKEAFSGCKKLWIEHFPESLESIGEKAFYKCSSIPEVTLPENLRYLGDRAFHECNSIYKVILNSINLETSYAFSNCRNIEKLVIGNNVKTLPALGCSSIKSLEFIDIDNSKLQTINDDCFAWHSLKINALPKSIRRIGNSAFQGVRMCNIDFHDIEYLGSYAFAETSGITEVILPDKEITMSSGVFFACADLKEVTIYGDIIAEEKEGYYSEDMFRECEQLHKVTIGKNLHHIPEGTFCSCPISDLIFENRDDSLSSLTFGSRSFGGCNLSGEISFPEGLYTIGKLAFCGNNISSIVLPSTCRVIEEGCFENNELTSIKLNNGLQKIGNSALSGNLYLSHIDIPETCDEIDSYVLDNCRALKSINMYPVNPPTFGDGLGRISTDVVIYVPEESINKYRSIRALDGYEIRPLSVNPESISLNMSEIEITVGETVTLTATVMPENTTDKTIVWSSSAPSIAKIDKEGTVTAISTGNAVITAYCGKVSATCHLTVKGNAGLQSVGTESIKVTGGIGEILIAGTNGSETIRIMRPDGKIIYTGNDTSVNSLATGCYFVIIDNVSTFKVIVH